MADVVTLVTPAVGDGGGIASMARTMIDSWPNDGPRLQIVETSGSSPVRFARSMLHLTTLMRSGEAGTLWIMLALRGSTIRKSLVMRAARRTCTPYVVHIHGGGFVDFYNGLPRRPR